MILTRNTLVMLATMLGMVFPFAVQADSIWGQFDSIDASSVPLSGEPEDEFAGRIQFGYLAATGNSETTNINSKVLLGWDKVKWRHAVIASGIYSRDDESTIAERYRAGYKADRKLSEKNYLFGTVSWEQDVFSGYEQRTIEAVGYGRRLLESEKHVLDLEIGVGARQTELVAVAGMAEGVEQDETIGRLAGDYKWKFAENSDFSQHFVVESGDLNTYIESVTSVTSQLLGELDLVVSYTVQRNSDVPVGLEKTDTYTTVSVQYNF